MHIKPHLHCHNFTVRIPTSHAVYIGVYWEVTACRRVVGNVQELTFPAAVGDVAKQRKEEWPAHTHTHKG